VSPWSAADLPRRYNAAADLLDGNLEAGRGDRTAIRTTGGAELTYTEVAASANRAGNALRELGVEMENRVLMAVLDSSEFAATFFGAIKIGAVPIPVNTNLKPADYARLLDDSRARVAVVSAPLADLFRQVRGELRHLRHLVVIGEAGPDEHSFADVSGAAPDRLEPADTTVDDMCFWLYSSGTTGTPKGVVHLQHDMRYVVENYGRPVLGLEAADVTFSVAKLYFAYGLGNALYMPFGVGASTVLLAGPPAPATALEVVRHFRPSLYFAVPTSYANTLAAEPRWRGRSWSGGGTAPARTSWTASAPRRPATSSSPTAWTTSVPTARGRSCPATRPGSSTPRGGRCPTARWAASGSGATRSAPPTGTSTSGRSGRSGANGSTPATSTCATPTATTATRAGATTC
jgi:acyl-coenzyme A synthetase/AMP-(fatty) acid ligase